MAKIARYAALDFSGGVRRDKSPYELHKNELLDARNVEISERGRLKVRLGSEQVGNTLSGNLENGFIAAFNPAGTAPLAYFLVNNNASTGVVSNLGLRRLNTAITTASTTIVVNDAINPGANVVSAITSPITINGDIISFTGTSGNQTLTGVTGITRSHAANTPIHFWATVTQSGTAIDASLGCYYVLINNALIFGGGGANLKQANTALTVSDVSGEPAVILLTNYRDRIYGAGDGSSGTNGSPVRVSFSARGDGTSWTTATDYFDVSDQTAGHVTAFRVLNNIMGIFKNDSIFTYDEIELKQRITGGIGAYNHKVPQEINGIIYTFSPSGIFATNLSEAKSIGEPVREFWENFVPQYSSGNQRVCTNTWATTFGEHYILYIGDITSPTTSNDVALIYNTRTEAWTVSEGAFVNFLFAKGFSVFGFGDNIIQRGQGLFGGGTGSQVFRMFSNRYRDLSGNVVGGNILEDVISDTGEPINALIETGLLDMTLPDLFKRFKFLRVMTEAGIWNVEYRIEDEQGISDYRRLGTIRKRNEALPFPKEAQGYRVGLRFTEVQTFDFTTNARTTTQQRTPIFNGYALEDTEVVPRT